MTTTEASSIATNRNKRQMTTTLWIIVTKKCTITTTVLSSTILQLLLLCSQGSEGFHLSPLLSLNRQFPSSSSSSSPLSSPPSFSFTTHPVTANNVYGCHRRRQAASTRVNNGQSEDNDSTYDWNNVHGNSDDDDEKEMDWTQFNPFNYQASEATKTTTGMGSGGNTRMISLRKKRMKELTIDLLDVVGDEEATKTLLDKNHDFLLEPLEDMDAVLEPDSIYTPRMFRAERYHAFKVSMDERIQSSRNGQAQAVLKALRDYVMQFEEQ